MAASNQVRPQSQHDLSQYPNKISRVCIFYSACLLVLTTSGCGLMANALYIVKGVDAPAEFDELKDKKVAVIVSTTSGLNADASGILMSRHINELLARNVKKIEMINPEEVDRIINDQPIANRAIPVIGGRLRADYVVLVEVSNLKLMRVRLFSRDAATWRCPPTKSQKGIELYLGRLFLNSFIHSTERRLPISMKCSFNAFICPSSPSGSLELSIHSIHRLTLPKTHPFLLWARHSKGLKSCDSPQQCWALSNS